MSRSNLDKVLKRIEKSEEKNLKMLFRQRKDLLRALEDNERLIETKLNRGASEKECKIEQEIDKLTKRLESLRAEMEQVRVRREAQVKPLRQTSHDLREKLKLVDSQIDSTHELRERRQSRSDLFNIDQQENEEEHQGHSLSPPFARSISGPVTSGLQDDEQDEFSPTSPPPYSPYWKGD